MSERWTVPNSDLVILDALGQELGRASADLAKPPQLPFRSLRLGRRSMAIVLIALLSLAGGALAATGVLSTGSIIPAGGPPGPPENRLGVSQVVLAQGNAPVAGPWRITTYGSQGVVDGGQVLEPRGLPCVELSLAEPPRTPLLGSSFCGREIPSEFTAGSLSVVDPATGQARLILFGTAPEQAANVTLLADGMAPIPAQVFDGPEGYGGDLWALSVPPGPHEGEVQWLRPDGARGGVPRDVSDSFGQLERVRRAWRP
jgi:hypothetical protein